MQQKRRIASSEQLTDGGLTTTNEERKQLTLQQELNDKTNAKKPKHIVVHIRRGDVSPCSKVVRYLPNIHYLQLLDMYASSKSNYGTDRTITTF